MFELKYETLKYSDEVTFHSLQDLMQFVILIGTDSIVKINFVDALKNRHEIKARP